MPGPKLDARRAAAYLGISRAVFYSRVRPHVPTVKIGARIVFDQDDLDAYAELKKERPANAEPPRTQTQQGPRQKDDGPRWVVGENGRLVLREPGKSANWQPRRSR